MALELTKTELERLKKRVADTENRRNRHPLKISAEKEQKIINLVLEGKSNSEIKKIVSVSDDTIIKIRKENGLWGI